MRDRTICACGHDRELHVRPLFKGGRAWCAHVACDCVEFMKFVPDGADVTVALLDNGGAK